MAAAVGLGVWAIAPSLYPLLGKEDWWTPFNDWALASTTVVWHGIGVGIYVQMRMSSRAQARLLVLQQHAAAHERQLAAANLLALQARVEPDLLFERLQRIDQELAEAPGRAEARLAALIDLLRAQQPHLKMDVSTLAREVEAVRAYARLMSQDGHNTERLQLVQMAELPDWPLAPMVLLPLVRPLLDHSRTLWSLTLRGSVEPRPARAELLLQALGPDAASSQAAAAQVPVAELRHRLRTVHGDQAMLDALPNEAGGLAAFRLTWPLQPAPTSP
jgi:LytS/YehU family sensor histidine kinase